MANQFHHDAVRFESNVVCAAFKVFANCLVGDSNDLVAASAHEVQALLRGSDDKSRQTLNTPNTFILNKPY